MVYKDVRTGSYWQQAPLALGAGPKLVENGQVNVRAQFEGFTHDHVYMRMNRSALGVTTNRHLLLATIPTAVSLQQEAAIMKTLGCVEAMNLDGGASSALYVNGRIVTAPGRELTNLLAVYTE